MAGEFINTKIEKVVIHKIFRRENKNEVIPPFFNQSCSELDAEAKRALTQRITRAFSNNKHAIQMSIDDTGEESVFGYLREFWLSNQSDIKLLELSERLTYLLAHAQNSRVYPDGIVIILKGTTKPINLDYIAVIKAEISDGFNIENSNGENLFQYVNNLLLTGQQKLHKIGFFINTQVKGREINKNDVLAFLFDSNTAESVADAKSTYFYKTFLGLKFREDADVFTNKFYVSTKKFINESGLDTEERIRLQTALNDYLMVQNNFNICVEDFANQYIQEAPTKDIYLNKMQAAGIPTTAIRRDLSMVADKKTRKLSFENAIRLTAPIDEFEENITIREDEQGNTVISIRGRYLNE